MTALKELEKDFKELLSCIDFNHYDPYSKLFMRALFVGQMYLAVKEMPEMDSDIEEELNGAKTYYHLFKQTDDNTYKDMASDELRHAGILIKKYLAKATDSKERDLINEYEQKRLDMLRMIEPKKMQSK